MFLLVFAFKNNDMCNNFYIYGRSSPETESGLDGPNSDITLIASIFIDRGYEKCRMSLYWS